MTDALLRDRQRARVLFEVAPNALADKLRHSRDMVELPQDLAAQTDETAPVDSLVGCLPRVV